MSTESLVEPRVGDEIGPYVVDLVDPEKMKLMAALLRDPNPIHFDPEAVRRLGLGDRVVNQGPINLSYLANMLMRWAGGPERVRSLDVRFLANVFAGDRVECRGRIAEIDLERRLVALEVEARVGDTAVLAGRAAVSL